MAFYIIQTVYVKTFFWSIENISPVSSHDDVLLLQVRVLVEADGRQVRLYQKPGRQGEVTSASVMDTLALHSHTLYAELV